MYDDLIQRLHRYTENYVAYKLDADFASAVQEAADALERKHGKWLPPDSFDDLFHCSVCDGRKPGKLTNFCPNCGADMRGEDDV